MSRKRMYIRRALVQNLKGKTIAEDRVYGARRLPTWKQDLPAILVYSNTESLTEWAEAPREYQRTPTIRIECVLSDQGLKTPLEDALDIFAEDVEQVLKNDPFLGPKSGQEIERSADLIPVSVATQADDDGERLIGSVVIEVQAIYYDQWVRDLSLDAGDLDTVNIEWDITGDGMPSGNVDAEDTVTGVFNS